VSFAAITLCAASQRVFVVVYFVMTQSGPSYSVKNVPQVEGEREGGDKGE
jgi:hypothetical protein